MQLNRQLKKITSSPIRSFNEKIQTIEGLIPLTIGEPDFETPHNVKMSAIEAIQSNKNGYSPSKGLLELRQAIARYILRHYQLTYNPETEIIVTAGPTQALFACMMTLLNPGDKVITPSPNYVIYTTQAALANAELIQVDVSQSHFILTPELLEETLQKHPETKVLLLNHPSNPTGATYTKDQLEALVPIIKRHQLWVISDEIYSELTYHQPHISFASLLRDQTLYINGLSKSHAMTGWRSGFIAGPADVMTELFKVHQAMVNTPNTQMQYASITAYDECDYAITEMRQTYLERRNFLLEQFNALHITTVHPDGAFYLFVKVPEWFNGDDVDFCTQLAQEAKVGTIPGSGFGRAGAGYFRISYAASMAELKEAMTRIVTFIQQHQPTR